MIQNFALKAYFEDHVIIFHLIKDPKFTAFRYLKN